MASVAAIAIAVGQITKLTAVIQDGYGHPMLGSALSSPLVWTSSAPAVAVVSPIVACVALVEELALRMNIKN